MAIVSTVPLCCLVLLLGTVSGLTATRYVNLNNSTPAEPFTSWATAATNIQDALDVAVAGDAILVTNGVYQTGARAVYGMSNRVAVTRPVMVQSVNGPEVTIIAGNRLPGTVSGPEAVRCVYLTNGAVLAGFTLTNGATSGNGGGAWCESTNVVISNCILSGNYAGTHGGAVFGGTLSNCTVVRNTAFGNGGGAESAVLSYCVLATNVCGYNGGGANLSALTHCALSGNSATYGGGAMHCTLRICRLSGNSGNSSGGGANSSMLDGCILTGNLARAGAGAVTSTVRNSQFSGNRAQVRGGGADNCTLTNCTLTGNSTAKSAGGAWGGTINNCILFYNSAPSGSNYLDCEINYSCTLPLPAGGIGNVGADPQLADLAHISAGSPARGAGAPAFSSGTDIDGQPWANPPSIGCDEFVSGGATGSLSVAISAILTNATPNVTLDFIAQISGNVSASRWEFGDGTVLSNRPFASHSWSALGDYAVILRAYNDTYPAGITATVTVHIITQPVYYVAAGNATPQSPFLSWATAATNIQDAVDAVTTAGALVLVSNGVYTGTARLVNNDVPHRLVIDKRITVQSVNGPDATVIQGQPYAGPYNAIRCAYLVGGASLFGFTLTNGTTFPVWSESSDENQHAGGVWCESPTALVSNCVIVACSAGGGGGGSYGGTLSHCTYLNNRAAGGGGAYLSILNHCTLLTNSAGFGGGAYNCTLNHCLLAYNSALRAFNAGGAGGGAEFSALYNCTLMGNHAYNGGAVNNCAVTNSAITGNSVSSTGGGANASALYNCTVTANSADISGGGVAACTNFNSVVFYNSSPNGPDWIGSSFEYSCTVPLPPTGAGNISAEPQLADAFHLSAGSPARGAGSGAYASGMDIDDQAWLNPPSAGCDEYYAGSSTGALSVAILAPYTNVAAGYVLDLRAAITGHASASVWDFGDGTVVSNRPFISHSWAMAGDYVVSLTAFNDSFPAGVTTNLTVHVQSPIHYVVLNNPTPLAPYESWATAATTIQEAVDATFVGGTIIVSNGIYEVGGRIAYGTSSSRVAVTRQMTLQSANGPAVTVIKGAQPNGPNAVRCVTLTNGCVLSGFTLTGGATRTDGDSDLDQTGGGVWCFSTSVLISNCVLTANSAGGSQGGGVMRGRLSHCIISMNTPGGACLSVLEHCTVYGNFAGGARSSTLTSCLIENNLAGSVFEAGGVTGSVLTNCVLRGNASALDAGASHNSTMYNCLVISNRASRSGGGLAFGRAYNCTIIGNSAGSHGGGVLIASHLANCIIYNNTAPNGSNYWSEYLFNCCTLPAYPYNTGNITNAPAFVNLGDFRLQAGSPCINAGRNLYASDGLDLDGNLRIVGGTVDIGAYEFQSPDSLISYAWRQQYFQGLPPFGLGDFEDADSDGQNNWQEWRAGTIPTNTASVLRLAPPLLTATNVTLTWSSVASRSYVLEQATNLGASPAFSVLQSNVAGVPGPRSWTDTNVPASGPTFYRVRVEE